MIIIIEGIDRVGKTTLANMLVKRLGYKMFKDEFVLRELKKLPLSRFKDYSSGKIDTTIQMLKLLNEQDENIVVDRLHLTEFVYGYNNRDGNVNATAIDNADEELTKLGALLVYVRPTDITRSSSMAGVNLEEHLKLFDALYETSHMQKMKCTFDSLELVYSKIAQMTAPYDFYFASPFFNDEQIEREERLKHKLRSLGFSVFSPKEYCNLEGNASQEERQAVFNINCHNINKAKAVFAVTDGKDVGTIWEAGYAYGKGKPIVYFAETLGDMPFNLMLAQSGVLVLRDDSDLNFTNLGAAIDRESSPYSFEGEIE